MKTSIRILSVAVMTVMMAVSTSCRKDENTHLSTDPYTVAIENVSENAKQTLQSGDIVTFDVVLYYLDDSTPEGYRTVTDNGSVTAIELTEGLELKSFGAVMVSEETSGTETVTVRLPHGYQNGNDMIRTLKLDCL